MTSKPAKAFSSPSTRHKKESSGFVILPILLIVALGVAAMAAKSAYDKQQVLGEESSLIAQAPPPGGDGGGSAPQQSAPAPQQESQPAQQQPQQSPESQPPQQNQAPQQQAPQPGQGTAPQGNTGGFNSQPQNFRQSPNQQNYQDQGTSNQQYQQKQGGGPQGQQGEQRGQQGGFGQNQETGQGTQQRQPGTGPQGQGGQGGQQGPQPYVPQFSQEQYQQFQKQYEQEAGKYGFQINGSLPSQFLDRQNSFGQGQTGTPGQPGRQGQGGQTAQGTGQGPQNQNPQNFFSSFQALPTLDSFPTIQGNFTVNGSGGKNINLNDRNTRIQLWGQTPNSPLTAFGPDGSQVEIDKAEFEKINAAMKLTTGSEVTQNGNNFSLKRGQIEARTNFPISFNVATKTFSVQTPNGEKEIAILPDEAAQKLLENKVFSELQTETVTGEEGTTETQATVSLTELDNKPVYEVQGASRQKFLGFAPVSISKTVYVSAETGDQVKTQQPFTSQLLDLISF